MNRVSVRAACLLLAATAWLAVPASAADLPLNTPLFIRSEANGRVLAVDPTAATLATADLQLEVLGSNMPLNTRGWTLLPSGQQGRVLIFQAGPNVLLDADTAANETDPARLKVSAVTANPPLSQQWRIIEADTGAFLIMNAQTGRLLDADHGTLNSANGITKMQLLGRAGSTQSNRQWRFISSDIQPTNAPFDARKPLLPPLIPKTIVSGPGDFQGKGANVTVEVELVGSGTNELSAQVTMTATGNGMTLSRQQSYSLVKVATGKRIFLLPGFPTSQSCTYVGKVSPFDIVVPGTGLVVPPSVPAPRTNRIINFCLCVGDPGGPAAGRTRVIVVLESIPHLVDVP